MREVNRTCNMRSKKEQESQEIASTEKEKSDRIHKEQDGTTVVQHFSFTGECTAAVTSRNYEQRNQKLAKRKAV